MKNKGVVCALAAYVLWGLLPVYWKWLKAVPALQLLSHRIVWSFLLLVAVILVRRGWTDFRGVAFEPKVVRVYAVAAVLIAINWLTYVWAVNSGHIVETALGYFINPLLSVLLGVVVFRERLRPLQWVPVVLAAAGVVYLTIHHGRLPWMAVTLASSFALYGLVKKTAPLNAVYGLTMETAALFLPACAYLAHVARDGSGAFLHAGTTTDLVLTGAGVVTTVPLLLFAYAAPRVPLSVIGIMQYVAPSLQFAIGVLVYKEPFGSAQAVGFGLVWTGLVIFAVDSQVERRRAAQALLSA